MEKVARKVCKTGRRMREIKDAHDLAKVWSDGSLINEKALDDPAVLKKLDEIFKGTPYEITEEE